VLQGILVGSLQGVVGLSVIALVLTLGIGSVQCAYFSIKYWSCPEAVTPGPKALAGIGVLCAGLLAFMVTHP
jgi:hypothetical protein